MESARRARRADAPLVAGLCRLAVAELAGERGGAQLVAELLAGRTEAEVVDDALVDPSCEVVVGEIDGAPLGVGIAVATGAPRVAQVRVLYVEAGGRAVGLGEAILLVLTAWASSHGCTGIEAFALPGSRPSKSFFETNGMVARALVMHRSLP